MQTIKLIKDCMPRKVISSIKSFLFYIFREHSSKKECRRKEVSIFFFGISSKGKRSFSLFKVPYATHVSLFVIDKPAPVASPTGIDSGDKPQITVEKHLISGTE